MVNDRASSPNVIEQVLSGKRSIAMQQRAQQLVNSLSRRSVLRLLAGLMLGLGIEGCAQSPASYSSPATPTPRPIGSVLYLYRNHKQRVIAVAWSPNGTYIASGSLDKTVQVWAASPADHVQPFIYRGHTDSVNAVDWSPDSQRVVSGASDKTVQIWDARSGGNAIICRGHTDVVNTVKWSPDGNSIASGSADGTVRLWDAATGKQKFVYRGHKGGVNSVCWSPDSQQIVSGSMDTTAQILNAATGEHILTYRGHSNTVSSVSWSPDGTRIVSGSWDKTAQVWNATTGKVAYTYDGYNVQAARTNSSAGVLPDLILIVAWSHNGKRIAIVTQVYCGDNCGVVVTWDADTERNFAFYIDTPVFALAWSPDDTRFVTSTDVTSQGTGTNSSESDNEAGSYVQITKT
jgi:eukaryotic-like serine/threonine-protein kinase